MKEYFGSEVTAPRIRDLGTRWNVSGQLHAPATLHLGKALIPIG